MENNGSIVSETLPMMALRGITVFPDMIINFDVERKTSIASLAKAAEGDRRIFLTAQKDVLKEDPEAEDLFNVGTICILRQFLRTQGGGMRVMIEGKQRALLQEITVDGDSKYAAVTVIDEDVSVKVTTRVEALIRQAIEKFNDYTALSGGVTPETLISLTLRGDPGYIADYIAQNAHLKHTEKQAVLETGDPIKRLKLVVGILAHETEVLTIEQEMGEKLHEQLTRMQRENVLREQIRVIQSELGEDDSNNEIYDYREKIAALKLSEEIEKKLLKETDRLAKQPFGSAEASVIRSYLDLCTELPWHKRTKERADIHYARKILDDQHFGLDKVKERIIEFLAVKQLAPDIKGSILCLVGPPGVGKTSVAISVAKALNRKLSRMSLGGVHDEAEIRGHRKTYVGAMPGRIIAAVNQAGVRNPLLLLDEIDKLGSDYRGDPSSALLEALDPEQNATFRDHYLEIPFDLSEVLFITTANTTDTIPRPLLDRMEIIELSSYTDEEKLQIAKLHLLPKQRKKHGLSQRQLKIGDDVLREIIAGYTKESGVRQLERELGKVCRKTAVHIADASVKSVTLRSDMLGDFLGVRKYILENISGKLEIGVVNGLAWTSAGGELLEVEASVLEGSGKLELTGNLGDVMKESAHTAISYIRGVTEIFGIDRDFYKTKDIHIHFPEGAVPKDGPSAGITIAVAVVSALTGRPVRKDVAMTGEISLRGRVLPIGGLKEKTMAALRSSIHTVIIPAENERDLDEIDQTVRRALTFITVSEAQRAIETAVDFSVPRVCGRLEDLAAAELMPEMAEHIKKEVSIRQ